MTDCRPNRSRKKKKLWFKSTLLLAGQAVSGGPAGFLHLKKKKTYEKVILVSLDASVRAKFWFFSRPHNYLHNFDFLHRLGRTINQHKHFQKILIRNMNWEYICLFNFCSNKQMNVCSALYMESRAKINNHAVATVADCTALDWRASSVHDLFLADAQGCLIIKHCSKMACKNQFWLAWRFNQWHEFIRMFCQVVLNMAKPLVEYEMHFKPWINSYWIALKRQFNTQF